MGESASTGPVDLAALKADALFHLATADEWSGYQDLGQIAPTSLESEGFVHCSWRHQVPATLARHFAGIQGLLAVEIDPEGLGDVTLVEEDTTNSGQAFPHIYGPVPAQAVRGVVSIT